MNAIKDVMMNKVLAGEAGKEKAREWGRWLATEPSWQVHHTEIFLG